MLSWWLPFLLMHDLLQGRIGYGLVTGPPPQEDGDAQSNDTNSSNGSANSNSRLRAGGEP
jgi:hypothetical protein